MSVRRCTFGFAFFTLILRAAIVDRLAIAVDHQVVTELQLDEELRVTALMNRKPITRDRDTRRAAADRLIQQLLVKREMNLGRYPIPTDQDVQKYAEGVRDTFGGKVAFEKILTSYDLTEAVLTEHLSSQLTTLRFVEYRFRPDVDISESDIDSYYQSEVGKWKASHSTPPPSLDEMRESIIGTITSQRIDTALDTWLEESRKQVSIIYLDKSLD